MKNFILIKFKESASRAAIEVATIGVTNLMQAVIGSKYPPATVKMLHDEFFLKAFVLTSPIYADKVNETMTQIEDGFDGMYDSILVVDGDTLGGFTKWRGRGSSQPTLTKLFKTLIASGLPQ